LPRTLDDLTSETRYYKLYSPLLSKTHDAVVAPVSSNSPSFGVPLPPIFFIANSYFNVFFGQHHIFSWNFLPSFCYLTFCFPGAGRRHHLGPPTPPILHPGDGCCLSIFLGQPLMNQFSVRIAPFLFRRPFEPTQYILRDSLNRMLFSSHYHASLAVLPPLKVLHIGPSSAATPSSPYVSPQPNSPEVPLVQLPSLETIRPKGSLLFFS